MASSNYMSGMRSALISMLDVPVSDPEDFRRKKLVNILLLGIVIFTAIILLIEFVYYLQDSFVMTDEDLRLLIIIFTMLISSGLIYGLNRYGQGVLASWLLVLVFIAIASLCDAPVQVVDGRGLIVFSIPIFMAGVLIRPGASFVAAFFSSVALAIVALGEGMHPNEISMLIFFMLALVSWALTRGTSQAISELTAANLKLSASEEALRESEEMFRLLFDNASDGIACFDKEGFIVDINPRGADLAGMPCDYLLGMNILKLLPILGLNQKDVLSSLHKTLSKDPGKDHLEYEIKNARGELLTLDVRFSRIIKDGEIIGLSAFASDVTGRRRTKEDLAKVQKLEAVGVLAGGIAHDFNNILVALWGNLELIGMQTEPESETAQLAAEAQKACNRARDLTQQLLTFSKGGAPVKEKASLAELIKDCANFSLRGSNTRCEFVVDQDLHTLEIDEGQINQVINNLIINADQAMPDGGTIKVSMENIMLDAGETYGIPLDGGNYIKVSIEDRGTGIPREHLPRIFDPYYTTKQKGSGLGLAICYSIVKNHGGCLGVDSQIGEGTTFVIYLPAFEDSVRPEDKKREEIITGEGRVLLMDDEEQLKIFIGKALRSLGYEVEFASDGVEALLMYREAMDSDTPFDAVILDLTIPGGMGGRQTIEELIKIDPRVKAIVASGYSNNPILADHEGYGFKGMLAKPFEIRDLGKVLHEVLSETQT